MPVKSTRARLPTIWKWRGWIKYLIVCGALAVTGLGGAVSAAQASPVAWPGPIKLWAQNTYIGGTPGCATMYVWGNPFTDDVNYSDEAHVALFKDQGPPWNLQPRYVTGTSNGNVDSSGNVSAVLNNTWGSGTYEAAILDQYVDSSGLSQGYWVYSGSFTC